MGSLGTAAGSNSVLLLDVPMAIVIWMHLVMTCLRSWTSESIELWLELTGYRLEKVSHCKFTNSRNEHEFVIYEFSHDKKCKLLLRTDRSAGDRKGVTTSPSSSSEPFGTDFSPQFSGSSLSMKGNISKISGSIRHAVRRLSDTPLSYPSAISSNQYLAADTVTRISRHPSDASALRTIAFSGDRSLRPSLWDIMILVNVVHMDSIAYTLLGRQCYWFADAIFGLLEKWAEIYDKKATTTYERGEVKWGRRQASIGNLGLVPIHRRDPIHITKIWDNFAKERQAMQEQRDEYERIKTEETQKMNKLAGQVAELESMGKKEREKERREREEKEQRMREVQEERERRLRKGQHERERRHREKQRLLKQQIADQQQQLEKYRQWTMCLQRKEEETKRRFQQMEQCIVRMSDGLIPPPTS